MFHSFSAPHDTIKKEDLQEKENFAILILYVARAADYIMKADAEIHVWNIKNQYIIFV